MIRSSERLIFNGEDSTTYNILNVNINSGLLSEPFASSRSINETRTRGNDIPFFHEIKEEPLEFTCQLAVENTFTEDDLRQIRRWLLSPTYYADLIFSEDPNKVYYALVIGQPQIFHNGAGNGYVEVTFRTSAPWAFGSYISQSFDMKVNPTGTNQIIVNNGDKKTNPIFTFTKSGDGDITVINLSDSGKQMKFTGVKNGEIVEIDGNSEVIENSPLAKISFSGSTVDGETITIGARVYEFDSNSIVTAGRVPIDISSGSSATLSADALATAINNDVLSVAKATRGTGNTVDIAGLENVVGSSVNLSESCANASWDNSTLVDRNVFSLWDEGIISLGIGNNTLQFLGTYDVTIKFQPKLM